MLVALAIGLTVALIQGASWTLIWSLSSIGAHLAMRGQWHGVMRPKSAAATMDQTDIRGLVTTMHRSVVEAASL